MGAAMTLGMVMQSMPAEAATKSWTDISGNITAALANLPSLMATLSYLFGILLSVLGILKIKDHVENPSQTPLKEGAIRLLAGGALFALPIIGEAMQGTLDTNQASGAKVSKMQKVTFSLGI